MAGKTGKRTGKPAAPAARPLPGWIAEYADRLKADLRAAELRIDWSRTPAFERAFIDNLVRTIDSMAGRWALDVAHLEDSSRTLFGRLRSLPTPTLPPEATP
jgi:hypothetical protein